MLPLLVFIHSSMLPLIWNAARSYYNNDNAQQGTGVTFVFNSAWVWVLS